MQLQKFYQTIPGHTKPYHDQISQFWPNFTFLKKFHNFNQIWQFWQGFTISTKFHTIIPNFTKSTKFDNFNKISQCGQCKLVQTFGTISTFNKAFLCPIGQFRNPCNVFSIFENFKILFRSQRSFETLEYYEMTLESQIWLSNKYFWPQVNNFDPNKDFLEFF